MYPRRIALAALTLLAVLGTAGISAAQDVHIVPHPDHPAPHAIYLASARMDLRIEGGAATTTITQIFSNPNPWRAEGIYLFPLPDDAAVTGFRLTLDGRPVQGKVLDREEARRIYLDIVRRIRDPALMEWVGHRVFQARIFPFEPCSDRTLTLSWAQVLPREGDFRVFHYLDGRGRGAGPPGPVIRRLREPGDRPEGVLPRVEQSGRGGRAARPGTGAPSFSVEGTILKERYPIRSVYSPTHTLDVTEGDGEVRFGAEGTLEAGRGFTLYYASAPQDGVGLDLLTHRIAGEEGFFLLTISAGTASRTERLPRDIVFVLDRSGSMGPDGKLDQALEALRHGLGTLQERDRFGLVTYSSSITLWQEGLSRATGESVRQARSFIDGITAGGGTHIEGALQQAARLVEVSGDGRPAYVVFLTDGLPTAGERDPQVLLDQAAGRFPERTRLFTWGVGYDVNAFLLDRLSQQHHGRAAYVEPGEDLEARVSAFFGQISTPVLADLGLDIQGVRTRDRYPRELSDLFRGGEITVMGRYAGEGEVTVRLTGRAGDEPRTHTRTTRFPAAADEAAFLAPLWAQRKVGYLLEQIRLNGESEELKEEIVALGERYALVTPYTSYLVTEEMANVALERMQTAQDASFFMARAARETAARPDASIYAGAAGSQEQTGMGAIQIARAEKALQQSLALQSGRFMKVRRAAGRTFRYNEEEGLWRQIEIEDASRIQTVTVGSESFGRLLDQHPETARWAAVGERVQVILDGRVWEIRLPED